MDPIPLVDLAAQHTELREEILSCVDEVLSSSSFILGDSVKAFEDAFASFCDLEYCIGVANGTDAIELTLRAFEVGVGDEVVLPANTFFASAAAVVRAGAVPRFADCDEHSMLIDPVSVEATVSEKTRAILPVHLYGQMAHVESLRRVADASGLLIVEDAAQAHGAMRHGKGPGRNSAAACFSFYPGKNLGALGDGGAIVTSDSKLAERLRLLRHYGSPNKYDHTIMGFNSRLDALQAALLLVKLSRLRQWNQSRTEAAKRYDELLCDMPEVIRPVASDGNQHVWHLYVIRVPARDKLLHHLRDNGIRAGIHYPNPLHLEPALAFLGYQRGAFPVAESVASRILSLPLYPRITHEQQVRVVETLRQGLS